jgi:ABC-2 type transport system permease protein
VNVVYVADIDLISDWFFYERNRGESGLLLDNVTFVLNAVDVLADDTSYIDLRKRRPSHRTLQEVEKQNQEFIKERLEQEANATKEAEKELEQARERFEKQRENIEQDKSLDGRTKSIMLQNIKATEERRLEVQQANIEQEKKNKIDSIKDQTERKIKNREDQIRLWAVLLSPWPAILLGAMVLSLRLQRERSEITPERHVTR